jgi:hypothetical protein
LYCACASFHSIRTSHEFIITQYFEILHQFTPEIRSTELKSALQVETTITSYTKDPRWGNWFFYTKTHQIITSWAIIQNRLTQQEMAIKDHRAQQIPRQGVLKKPNQV